ncbi:MAG: hypothetical protein Q8N68_03025 [bacterium]|nr:hypothetical protein [bacterium]
MGKLNIKKKIENETKITRKEIEIIEDILENEMLNLGSEYNAEELKILAWKVRNRAKFEI